MALFSIWKMRNYFKLAEKRKAKQLVRAALCGGCFGEALRAGEPWAEWGMDHPQGERTWSRPYNRAILRRKRTTRSSGRAFHGRSRTTTSPLWFGVKGEWDHGELSKCQAPKLVCDLWRVAFEAADRGENIQDAILMRLRASRSRQAAIPPTLIGEPIRLGRIRSLPNRRAFMFFSTSARPIMVRRSAKIESSRMIRRSS